MAVRDLARAPKILLLASSIAFSLGGCGTMAEREMTDAAPPPTGGVLTQAGTDAPAKPAKRTADGECLACFPGLFQVPMFGLR
jgi:hypothetical protein